MKRKLIIVAIACIFSCKINAQFLTQSADGKSTIPLPLSGLGLSVDIGKTDIAVGLNNYGKVLSNMDNKKNLFLGLNLSVKNSEGLSNLFSSGDIVPSGDFLGFLGWTWTNNKSMLTKWNSSTFVAAFHYDELISKQFFDAYIKEVKKSIPLIIVKIKDSDLAGRVSTMLSNKLDNSGDYIAVKKSIAGAKADLGHDADLKDFWSAFEEMEEDERVAAKTIYNNNFSAEKAKQRQQDFNKTIGELVPFRISPFIMGGISARSFNLFTKPDPANFANSFIDTLYRGGTIGLGLNVQYANFWLGVTYSYLDGDNFSSLSSKEYTIKTLDTSGNQSLTRDKKTTAYSGKYSKVQSNQFNVDLIWDNRFNDSSSLLANAYLRSSLFSRDTSYLQNYINLGIGLYFLGKKSKFLGGLYVELPDINNNAEKAKSPADRDIRSPLKKLTFGIVTKFSLSSILTFQNRPKIEDAK